MDLAATFHACRELHQNLPALLEHEVQFVNEQKIDLIVGDIPPACFEIAARANIYAVAVTNFTWDIIYRAYAGRYTGFTSIIEEMTRFYGKATLALALPYPCDMNMFPRRESIPWISRVSALARTQARKLFGLPQSATIVLMSFGGLGVDRISWPRLGQMTEFHFVTTGGTDGHPRGNIQILDAAQRQYEDLLRAVDVIVTKPGYGIVADALAHQLPVLYTDRGEFPEYPFLVQALNDLAVAHFIPQEELLAGNLRPYLAELLEKNSDWPAVPLNGAEIAAEKILMLLDHSPT